MGLEKYYKKEGGFSQFMYHQIGEYFSMNGFNIRVIGKIGEVKPHSGLPTYSNTSYIYVKLSDVDRTPEEIRIFMDRKAVMDIDWGHSHGGFKIGTAHVHNITISKDGTMTRSSQRELTTEEIAKFGSILKYLNPDIKLKK